jgi:peptidoglycan/xylan/chitin deacetylase (PgdA/CDA1 family)
VYKVISFPPDRVDGLRAILKQSAGWVARYSGLNTCFRARTRSLFRVVTYHGVDAQDHPVVNFDRLQIQPDLFTRQLESLARHYRVVALPEALAGFLAGRGWPERGLAITFDDGYRNNLDVAAPILQRLGSARDIFCDRRFCGGARASLVV